VQGGAYGAPTTPSSNPQTTAQSLGDGCLPRGFVRGIGRWDDRSREQNAFRLDLRPAAALATALAVAVAEGAGYAGASPGLRSAPPAPSSAGQLITPSAHGVDAVHDNQRREITAKTDVARRTGDRRHVMLGVSVVRRLAVVAVASSLVGGCSSGHRRLPRRGRIEVPTTTRPPQW
jgi:hypothetical protein